MDFITLLAERKIQEAIVRGELDNLSLKGQPIPHEDLSAVPEDLRMGYKILKNAGFLPEELQIRQEMLSLQDLIASCDDPEEERSLRKRLTLKRLHFDVLMEQNARNTAFARYSGRVLERLGL